MRRSSSSSQSSIPRRSSSIDNNQWNTLNQISSSNRQSVGRVSTGRMSSGRASSVGRQSILGMKNGTEIKTINTHEVAQSIYNMLVYELEFSQPISVKVLLLPSTSTFYGLFEYCLTFLGIQDVWNYGNVSAQIAQQALQANPNANRNPSSSQSSHNNVVQQNKARIEIILYYLGILHYTPLPKANILQTMTTPKNWQAMLLIIQFLCYNCKFLLIYDSQKLLQLFNKDHEIIHHYLKTAYANLIYDIDYLKSENHIKIKNEALEKYAEQIRGSNNFEQLKNDYESIKKQYEFLKSTENELEKLLEEEKELTRDLAEEERLLIEQGTQFEDLVKKVKSDKKNLYANREKIRKDEEALAIKDALYDKQLASGKQVDKMPAKHTQKLQELERLQNDFVENVNQTEDLQKKLISEIQKVKEAILQANSIVSKVKFNSSLALQEFPQIELIDFHRKNDILQSYKKAFYSIREKYCNDICKLPEQLSQLREELKIRESKIESFKVKCTSLEKENAKYDASLKELHKDSVQLIQSVKEKVESTKHKASKCQAELKSFNESLGQMEAEIRRMIDEHKKIELDLKEQQRIMLEQSEKNEKSAMQRLQDLESQLNNKILQHRQTQLELREKLHNFMGSMGIE